MNVSSHYWSPFHANDYVFSRKKSKKFRKYNNRGSEELTLKKEKKGKEKENGGTHFYIHVNIAQRNL